MRQLLGIALFTLGLFVAGVLTINEQLWHSARKNMETAARQSAERVDAILDEAREATNAIMPFAKGNCSPETRSVLNREAALKPHLRAVALLRGNTLWCSSFAGYYPLSFRPGSINTSRLTLYPGDRITPDTPLFVYLSPASGGFIAVSINGVHLQNALVPIARDQQLALVVGNRLLDNKGSVHNVLPSSTAMSLFTSSRYPFSIGYELPQYFSPIRLFHQGGILLVMSAFFSLTAGGLLRRYLVKYTTPAQNLKRALERGEIVPYYQPVVNGRTKSIEGFEVLARWKHPQAGFISPDEFIPVAERSGLIIPLTRHLMRQVQTDLAPLLCKHPDEMHIGINISAKHVKSGLLVEDCRNFLKGLGRKPVKLMLEITEREPLDITDEIRTNLTTLRNIGVELALDDFGTGYSGLMYLDEPMFDIIKIDKSFVSRITSEPDSTRLMDCVIDIARKMNLSIIAEGVETQQQAHYLTQQGISLLQGYYFFKPMPLDGLSNAMLKVKKQKHDGFLHL